MARRPPGLTTRASSPKCDERIGHVPDPEGHGGAVARRIGHGDAHRVSPNERNPAARHRACRTLPRPSLQHLAGKIDADHAAARDPSHGGQREIRRTGAEIEHAGAGRQFERIHGHVAPAPIEARAQNVIQQVVARRDRVEHARDAAGRLVDHGAGGRHGCGSHGVSPSTPDRARG